MPTKPAAPDNFDIVVHLVRLKGLEEAARWLTTPRADLGGLTPEEALSTARKGDVVRLVLSAEGEERLVS